MAVFSDNTFALVPVAVFIRHILGILIIIVTVQKENNIGILLNGAGIPQIRKHRAVVGPLLTVSGKLGKHQDRNVQLFG